MYYHNLQQGRRAHQLKVVGQDINEVVQCHTSGLNILKWTLGVLQFLNFYQSETFNIHKSKTIYVTYSASTKTSKINICVPQPSLQNRIIL